MERFNELVADNRIRFNTDGVPRIKRFLSEVKQGLTSMTIWKRDEVGDTQEGRRAIREHFGDIGVFDTPKAVGLITKMIQLAVEPQENEIVLDFTAGSCTTAEAVLQSSHEDGGNRRFILVQLPEPTGRDDYKTIAEIGKERIRRVVKKLKDEQKGKLDLNAGEGAEDLGFRVFKLDESNYLPWRGLETDDPAAYAKQMQLFADPLLPGWKPDDVIFEVAVKEGFSLSSRIETAATINGKTIYRVTDDDKQQSFRICLDEKLTLSVVRQLDLGKNELFVCRDSALTDELAANLALQCRVKTI